MLTVCSFFPIYFFKIYTFADVIFSWFFFYKNGSRQLHICNSHLYMTFLIRFEFDHFDLWSKYSLYVIWIYTVYSVTVYTQMVRSALPYHLTESLSIFILDSRSNNNVNTILQCDKIQWHIRIKYEHAVANRWRNHINLQWMTTEKQLSYIHTLAIRYFSNNSTQIHFEHFENGIFFEKATNARVHFVIFLDSDRCNVPYDVWIFLCDISRVFNYFDAVFEVNLSWVATPRNVVFVSLHGACANNFQYAINLVEMRYIYRFVHICISWWWWRF